MPACFPLRFAGLKPGALLHLDVEAQLLLELPFFAIVEDEHANALDEIAEEAHGNAGARCVSST